MVEGLLNVNKPPGPTSHDIVAAVRRGTGERRVGHAGTLDPQAEGVLVLALGQATRLVEYLTASSKEYLAQITLGITTDTCDASGTVLTRKPLPAGLDRARVLAALERFRGEIDQVPPIYSAIKINGRSAHYRARAGEDIRLESRRVLIEHLVLQDFNPPHLQVAVRCSPGTYIRSLARDLGETLGCGAHLSALRRTASGGFRLEDATDWGRLTAAFLDGSWRGCLLPADLALDGTPKVLLDEVGSKRVLNGQSVSMAEAHDGLARAYGPDGRFVAVLFGDPEHGTWRPVKVFLSTT